MTDTPEHWIGRSRRLSDVITRRMVEEYRVTLGARCGPGDVPAGFQWCLSPDVAPRSDLGRDGHPRPGLFLPQLPLPRRMWAGGDITVVRPFRLGETVTRTSTISDVTFKQGRSGDLGFVTVRHEHEGEDGICVTERQDIVYRADPDPEQPVRLPAPGDLWTPRKVWEVTPDATMLFRYSALTFNGHRIHYDYPYATQVEGYGGLVVHGPLQATWMQNLAASLVGSQQMSFRYRGMSPLFAGQPVCVEAIDAEDGLQLRVRRLSDGVVTMQGSAEAT
ncbi:FAS1-like dehydratase domain-containing protein [Pseudooceanicola spongiae]|uniref:FAS1-like dehydratase domain-containing protein n=1 Tax=Pseudooceanicola spongiae TaxID=2613965 RepID=A0A7L9WQS6_9RHOB|nr:MaoC family dehydratase N-terminal domain-containing protein [Pseudooceanicola spongiae]QOL82671.1 hypothetical protein F3W81_18710 [Pseudooceanicola spongiae]